MSVNDEKMMELDAPVNLYEDTTRSQVFLCL
jgi:hypothetical protein